MKVEKEKIIPKREKRNKAFKLLAIILGLVMMIVITICLVNCFSNKTNGINDVSKMYDEYIEKNKYSVKTTCLNDDTKEEYVKSDNLAYVFTNYGEDNYYKEIVRDGHTYIIDDENKTTYKYQNNEMNLNKFINQFEEFKDKEYTESKEVIDGKKYEYQEYNGVTDWVLTNEIDRFSEGVKTRLYFKDEKLVYIKTISNDKEEVLKVDISDEVNNSLFELPTDYKEM